MATGLYQSGWAPRGLRKAWDRCSMDTASTASVLPEWCVRGAEITEAVAWFDDDGQLRALVADLSDGRRIDARRRARDWRILTYRLRSTHPTGADQ